MEAIRLYYKEVIIKGKAGRKMNLQKIYFETEDGVELCGLLHEPENKTEEIVIAVHGMQSNCMKKRDDILAREMIKNNISYFCFNNRGHDLVNSITKKQDGKSNKILSGSSLECIEDCYYDIKSAMLKMIEKGYKKIHLQGHSLGCTKIVYTYTKMKNQNEIELLDKIKSIILLSMVDIPIAINFFFQNDIDELISDMERKQREGNGKKVMLVEGATLPMCPNTFLNFVKNNKDIDFARYSDESYDFKELNKIEIPIFMRWGNKNELIMQDADKLVEVMRNKIKNKEFDIGYIDGAGHNYREKEYELASQIINFLIKMENKI